MIRGGRLQDRLDRRQLQAAGMPTNNPFTQRQPRPEVDFTLNCSSNTFGNAR